MKFALILQVTEKMEQNRLELLPLASAKSQTNDKQCTFVYLTNAFVHMTVSVKEDSHDCQSEGGISA